MARRTGRLSARAVEALTAPGRYPDGGGLYFLVSPTGTKAWIFRYSMAGLVTAGGNRAERQMGLGPYGTRKPGVSLAEARQAAGGAADLLRQKADPLQAREAQQAAAKADRAKAGANTFKAVAERFLAGHLAGLLNPKHRAQWKSTLSTYAYPTLGERPIVGVTRMDVADAVRPIWNTKRETARRVVQRMERVFRFATAAGIRSGENPASLRDGLADLLTSGAPGGVRGKRHHPALPWQQVPAFLAALRRKEGASARALELLVLTAARTGEVVGARWKEINWEDAVWTVPAGRMKGKREHRKPITPAVLAVLQVQAAAGVDPEGYVFPGAKRGQHLSNMATEMLLRGMNEGAPGSVPRWRDARGNAAVPHGFRSAFRDWAGETGQPTDLAEAALAHIIRDKTEAASTTRPPA